MSVYISIGNSDDKLSQYDWYRFAQEVTAILQTSTQVHGEWFSLPNARFQNACWCVDFFETQTDAPNKAQVKAEMAFLAKRWRQDLIAWVDGETEFIKGD